MPKNKTSKGTVAISTNDGRLRLRWHYEKKRYSLAIGLPDSVFNRAVAQRKAELIEEDIRYACFDKSLAKYKSANSNSSKLSVVEVFERFTEHKRRLLADSRSLDKYLGLVGHLQKHFRSRLADNLTEDAAFKFRDCLLKQVKPITARERIGMLRSAWDWAQNRKLVNSNPWQEVKVKVPPRQKPRPFTQEEITQICSYAYKKAEYQHYADLIVFCLSLGCRPGEAAGLRWKHLSEDCSQIWIGESWGRGRQRPTKNNQSRSFELTPEIQNLL